MKYLTVTIIGVSPLLVHRFGEDEALHATNGTKKPRNSIDLPRDIAERCLYVHDGVPCFPAGNVYRAIIEAGRQVKIGRAGLSTQRDSKIPGMFWLDEVMAPIAPGAWEVDARPVVIPATAGRILRYRPRFDAWSLDLTGSFDETTIAKETVIELFHIAGRSIGIGDFRPARRGTFGRFAIQRFDMK